MKIFDIPNASKMKEAVELLKSQSDRQKAQSITTVWSSMERKGFQKHLTVYVELGRSAVLIRRTQNERIILGDMHLTRTREFVKGLEENDENG